MKKLLLFLFIILALAFVSFSFLLNHFVDPEKITKQLSDITSEQLNADLNIDNLDIKLFPKVLVTIDGATLTKRNSDMQVKVSPIEFRLNKIIELLLYKKLSIESFSFDKLEFLDSAMALTVNDVNVGITTELQKHYDKLVQDNYAITDINHYVDMMSIDGAIKTGLIQYNEYTINSVATDFSLHKKLLTVNISNIAMYDGKISGKITSNEIWKKTSPINFQFDVDKIKTSSLLQHKFISEYTSLLASTNLEGSIQTLNTPNILNVVDVTGRLDLTDGYIKGIDINEMVKNNPKVLVNIGKKDLLKTEILNATSDYQLSKGIITSNEIFVDTGLIEITAKGSTDLNKSSVNYRISPKLDVIPGSNNRTIPLIPLNVIGTFDKIRFIPDVKSLIENKVMNTISDITKNPSNTKDVIKNLKKDLQTDRDNLIEGFKNIGKSGDEANDNELLKKPDEVINNLLRIVP